MRVKEYCLTQTSDDLLAMLVSMATLVLGGYTP